MVHTVELPLPLTWERLSSLMGKKIRLVTHHMEIGYDKYSDTVTFEVESDVIAPLEIEFCLDQLRTANLWFFCEKKPQHSGKHGAGFTDIQGKHVMMEW